MMFIFAFFLLGALGLYFSSVLEAGGGHKKNWCFCLGCTSHSKPAKLADSDVVSPLIPNAMDFEAVTSLKLLSQEKNGGILEIRDLHKDFAAGKTVVHAVNGLNIKMYQGQIFALLGHNGAGKTTTVQMLTGMLEPTDGLMQFLGYDLTHEREVL